MLVKLLLKGGDKRVEKSKGVKKEKKENSDKRNRRSFETEKLVRHAHIHPI